MDYYCWAKLYESFSNISNGIIPKVSIDQQMISKIEKNLRQVNDYELLAICKCLNVTPEELTDGVFL